MGIVIRQSFYSSIISYVGVVIGYINLLYLYPKYLSQEQVGLIRTIQDAAILLAPFAQFGLTQSIFRYYPKLVKSQSDSHSFISLMLLLALIGFSFFFIVFKIFENSLLGYFQKNAQEIISYSSWVLWLTLILVLTAVLEAYSRSLLKTIVPNLLREVIARLFLGVLVILYFINILSFDLLIIGSVLGYLICLLLLIFYLWRQGNFSINIKFKSVDKSAKNEMFKYTILSFAGMAGMILIGKVDSLMVSSILGFTSNAIYTTAFYMATVIEIPKRALSQITMPLISKAIDEKNHEEVEKLYRRTSINQFVIGALLLIGVWINIENIFNLMPNGANYQLGKWVVLIVGLGKLMDMVFGPSSEIIVLSKYYKFNIVLIVILAGIVIISNNLLIPRYGIVGAAIGSAFALITFNVVKYIFIYFSFKIQPFSNQSLKVVAISTIVVLLNSLLPTFNNVFIDLLVRSSIASIIFSVLTILFKISPEINIILSNSLEKFYQKLK
jgi:O-antigen/teichoic acid export membrane protein